MVPARSRTWIRKRPKSARIYGAAGLGDGTEFRRGPGLVLQGGGARQPQRAGKYWVPLSAWFRRGNRLRRSTNVVLQSGRARKFQRGKSAWVYESVRTRNSAGLCSGAGLVSHVGGTGEPHSD